LEGNFDCFGKGSTYCDQQNCKYRQWCLQLEDPEKAKKSLSKQEEDDSPSLHNMPECREIHLP
jgi:hypothetical protein